MNSGPIFGTNGGDEASRQVVVNLGGRVPATPTSGATLAALGAQKGGESESWVAAPAIPIAPLQLPEDWYLGAAEMGA